MAEQATGGEQGQQANQVQGQQGGEQGQQGGEQGQQGGEQGQQGGEMDGIGAAASQAYGEALEGGASPQEAFEAAGAAAQEVATEMGMPQEEFDQGMEAASGGFEDAMAGGASPAEAFGSAMDAANEATDPGTEMGPPPDGAPTGDMADVSGDMILLLFFLCLSLLHLLYLI